MKRNLSLDALRGLAILGMVFSSSIAFGILPSWMYHAQEPPPSHVYNPAISGLNWVDVVFPFFLFSMGAAIPLSLRSKERKGIKAPGVVKVAFRRLLLLTFFSYFTFYVGDGGLSVINLSWTPWLSFLGFILLFFQYVVFPTSWKLSVKYLNLIRFSAFLFGVLLIVSILYVTKSTFSLSCNDPIITILSQMAFLGSIAWWFSRNSPQNRMIILCFLFAFILSGTLKQGWISALYNRLAIPGLFKQEYLKYLFLVLPGTLAGDLFYELMQTKDAPISQDMKSSVWKLVSFLSLSIVVLNIVCFYSRLFLLGFFITLVLLLLIGYCFYHYTNYHKNYFFRLWAIGSLLLLLGLILEPFEGGIKKDPPSFSYCLVCAGFAFFMLLFFHGISFYRWGKYLVRILGKTGQSPMVAYVAGSLILIPFMKIIGLMKYFDLMASNPLLGILRGVLFTTIVAVCAICFTEKKWFWKS